MSIEMNQTKEELRKMFDRLAAPFPPSEIEWRIGRAGAKNGNVWASCLAYVDNRNIMDRLDVVVGAENWRNEFREWMGKAVMCGISIRINGEWITKYDASDPSEIEAIKGGISDAQKRAAVEWGIGRYLYGIKENYAKVHDAGKRRGSYKDKDTQKTVYFQWDEPALPFWAIPGGTNLTPTVKDEVYSQSIEAMARGDDVGLKQVWDGFAQEEQAVLWSLFNSQQRAAMKVLLK